MSAKPWLCCIILQKFQRQVAASARIAQKHVDKAAGQKAFCELFQTADQLIADLSSVLADLDSVQRASMPDESVAAERGPPFAAAPAEGLSSSTAPADDLCSSSAPEAVVASNELSSYPALASDDWIHGLADDRLSCIRPALVHDIKRAVGIETSPIPHPRTLRRNVAAHVRGKGALLKISELDAKGLRKA